MEPETEETWVVEGPPTDPAVFAEFNAKRSINAVNSITGDEIEAFEARVRADQEEGDRQRKEQKAKNDADEAALRQRAKEAKERDKAELIADILSRPRGEKGVPSVSKEEWASLDKEEQEGILNILRSERVNPSQAEPKTKPRTMNMRLAPSVEAAIAGISRMRGVSNTAAVALAVTEYWERLKRGR